MEVSRFSPVREFIYSPVFCSTSLFVIAFGGSFFIPEKTLSKKNVQYLRNSTIAIYTLTQLYLQIGTLNNLHKKDTIISEKERNLDLFIDKPLPPRNSRISSLSRTSSINRSLSNTKSIDPSPSCEEKERRERQIIVLFKTFIEKKEYKNKQKCESMILRLKEALPFFESSTHRDISLIIFQLEHLTQHVLLLPSYVETYLLNAFKNHLPKGSLYQGGYDEQCHQAGVVKGINEIHECFSSITEVPNDVTIFANLANLIREKKFDLLTETIYSRLERFFTKRNQKDFATKELAKKLARLVVKIEKHKKYAHAIFPELLENYLRDYNNKNNGNYLRAVNKLIKNKSFLLDYVFFRDTIEEIFESMCIAIPKKKESSLFETPITEERFQNFIKNKIKKHLNLYKDVLVWLVENALNIKQFYNQREDDSFNVGDGTCYGNSLDRCCELIKNPTCVSDAIPMRSSDVGRVAHARQKVNHQAFSYCRFGLSESKSEIAANRQDLMNLVKGCKIAIIALLPENPGQFGHAINVQIDSQNRIFRFIDDNLGIVEFETKQTLLDNLESWLDINYSDLPKGRVKTFNLIPN